MISRRVYARPNGDFSMKLFILASLFLVPTLSHAETIRPDTVVGERLVHKIAGKASDAFVSQTEQADADESSCESVKGELLEGLSQLELKGSDDLIAAKTVLEKGSCQKDLYLATVYLRSADSLN